MEHSSIATLLGLAIRARREALGLSQDAFADKIQMHRAYFGVIERGGKKVTLPTLARVAEGLGIKPSILLNDFDL